MECSDDSPAGQPSQIQRTISLGEFGYSQTAAAGDPDQLAAFIRRAIAFHGGVVSDDNALDRCAAGRCRSPGTYADLLGALNQCSWIQWPGLEEVPAPGLQRSVSTHCPTPTNSSSATDPAVALGDAAGGDGYQAASSSAPVASTPDSAQAFLFPPTPGDESRSASSSAMPPPDPAQALCGTVTEAPDGSQLVWHVYDTMDCFAGQNADTMSAANLEAVKLHAIRMGFAAFVVYQGTAYFRKQSADLCRANLKTSRYSISYLLEARSAADSCSDEACCKPSEAVARPSAIHVLSAVPEVTLNDVELCATPFHDLGALVVTAPPWAPSHMFSGRLFSLVLRNPHDPQRGLVLLMNASQRVVAQAAQGILAEMGDMAAALAEPAFYDALHQDPALLAHFAQSAHGPQGASGLQQILGGLSSETATSSAFANASAPPLDEAGAASAQAADEAPEDACECPICFEPINPGDAAMRCNGQGGVYHYFHAHCLQQWIQQSRAGRQATCPICRGQVQFNGARLQQFLEGSAAETLDAEERTFLQRIADGLSHKNQWSDMSNLEKGAYSVGIAAAAGWGFMLGYNADSDAAYVSERMGRHILPEDHQVAQSVGWVAGVLVRIARSIMKDRSDSERRR